MANITASWQTPLESLPDAPDEQWVQSIVNRSNVFDRQVATAFQGGININGNTTSATKDMTLVHGQSVTVANPLSVPIQGIFAIACVGLEVGSDGKPNGGIYDLAIPSLQAAPSTRGDGSWVIQASYAFMPSETVGVVGETIGPITRIRSNSTGLTSPNPINVCTQPSLTVTPGFWQLKGAVGFSPAATTSITQLHAAISATSATLPAADTMALPTNGEVRIQDSRAANVPGQNSITLTLPTYELTVANGTTKILFLVAEGVFSVSTLNVYGWMEAVRILPYLTGRTGRVKLWFFGG